MVVTITRKNFLAVEGRKLANGESSSLSAKEWLEGFSEIRDELGDVQLRIFESFERSILDRLGRQEESHG